MDVLLSCLFIERYYQLVSIQFKLNCCKLMFKLKLEIYNCNFDQLMLIKTYINVTELMIKYMIMK